MVADVWRRDEENASSERHDEGAHEESKSWKTARHLTITELIGSGLLAPKAVSLGGSRPMTRFFFLTLAATTSMIACGKCQSPNGAPADAAQVAIDASVDDARAMPVDVTPREAAAPPPSSEGGADVLLGDAGCRLVYGPAEQPFRGQAALSVTGAELLVIANDSGKPRSFPVPITPPPPLSAPIAKVPTPPSFIAMRANPCELAGHFAYCPGPGGAIFRTTLQGRDAKQIAKSQPGTRIAATSLGPHHTVVATLSAQRTTEGIVMVAYATLDDGETVRLSEEGAGATTVHLVPRGEGALAVYLDARTAMTPVHVRPLSVKDDRLVLGADVVLFVGGPPERSIDFALARADSALFALIPTARETTTFGMAALPLREPLKEDVEPVWSAYPNGLDPAPIAASFEAGARALVARVRPREPMPASPRVLELGRLDKMGVFTSLGPIADAHHITDVSLAIDPFGAVWITYGNVAGTWLERRVCP